MATPKLQSKKKLGDLLVEVGIITAEQLGTALEEQKRRGGKIGELLIELGFITEDVLLAFLGKQCGVAYVSLSEYGDISENVLALIPENVARRQTVLPLTKEGKTLTIAMADPLNVFATDDLKLMTGCEINPVIASEAEIKAAIDKWYSKGQESMEDVMKDIALDEEAADSVEQAKEHDAGADIASLSEDDAAPVVKIVNMILSNAVKMKASDIHMEAYEKEFRVRYRVDGVLHEQMKVPKKLQNALISRVKIMANLDIAERRLPQDGRIKIKVVNKEVDLRVSLCPVVFGEKVVMRILDSSALSVDIDKLGFDPDARNKFEKAIEKPYGICLVTGPTGSGKSTTLYSALSKVNYPDTNIMTAEDPVEFVIAGLNQVHCRADIGLTFSSALRSFLRQDPDIIMVGEIRDTETAEIAINAALTGHLVFSTLHTNDAAGTITRLSNMGIEPFLTTSTLILIIAQRLIRRLCKECAEPYEVPFEVLATTGAKISDVPDPTKVRLMRAKGCDKCGNTGYKGRQGIYEVLEMNDQIREMILERAPTHVLKMEARKLGMATLRQAGIKKVLAGVTTVEEVLRVTVADEVIVAKEEIA